MEEAGVPRVFDGGEPSARGRAPVDRQHLEPGLSEVGLEHERVVARADDDDVVRLQEGSFRSAGGILDAW